MSSTGTGVVAERRLRPLWDAIDSRQYKTALKLASTLLTKHPDSAYLLVLKALVLERMGKIEEAMVLCKQAKETGPIDELTLSTLQVVFQRLDHLQEATLCYEHACNKSPKNLELMMGLFNCYVRQYSYLKQQQTAMKMHKLFGEERFLLWAICSIQLQVWCGNGDKALLLLAEALLKKRLNTNGFEELEALLLYVTLLQDEGKFEAALDVLSSKSGQLFSILGDKLRMQGELLLLSHQYKRAAAVLQEVLETSPDDWAVFLQYLDASLEVSISSAADVRKFSGSNVEQEGNVSRSSLCEEEAEETLEKASAFIHELQNKGGEELRRGPFLGSIEIAKRRILLKEKGKESHQSNEDFACGLTLSIVDYFKRFGHMVSFASDVQNYLEFLHGQDCTNLVELLREACGKIEDGTPVKLMRQKISLLQVEVHLGITAADSDKDMAFHAISIAKLYLEGLKLSKDLDPQENLHGEELLTITTTLLIELFMRSKHPGYVVEAILLLEFGLAIRRNSFQYKIMLISLYSTLFSVSAAYDLYKTLDVKNILTETLSHHILPHLIKSSVMWSELDSLLKNTAKFYDDYLKEAADLTILAYRHCNYSKVIEFVQFKERLQHSHNLLVVKSESSILSLKQKADNPEERTNIFENTNSDQELLDWTSDKNLAALSFNEAIETRPWWSPAPGECLLTGMGDRPGTGERPLNWKPIESEKQCFQRQEIWRMAVCRRCLLPRLIRLSLEAVTVAKDGEDRETIGRSDLRELKLLIEKYGKALGWPWEKLEDLFTNLSLSKLRLRDVNVEASDLFSLALFWTAYQIASQPFSLAMSKNSPLKYPGFLSDLTKNFIAELTNPFKSLVTVGMKPQLTVCDSWSVFPSLVCLTTEALAWYSLFLQTWSKNLQPVNKLGKKKKKGAALVEQSEGPANGDHPSLLDALHSCIHSFCTEIEGLISWLTVLLEIPETREIEMYLEFLECGKQFGTAVGADIIPVPGLVIHLLYSRRNVIDELGEMLGMIFQTWQPNPFLQKLVMGQRATFRDLKELLVLRLKALQALKV